MRNNFWCITTYFNPMKYQSILRNYTTFSGLLKKCNINLLTVELAFNDGEFEIPESNDVLRLRSNSIMWQKERLINYAVENLPPGCDKFAWLDCDLIFNDKDWVDQAISLLDEYNIVQLFKKVCYLPNGHQQYLGRHIAILQSVVWQNKTHKNWLQRRKDKLLPFSSPGFAWAANRSVFSELYDKNIIGSGDTFLVDCLLDSWDIHGFHKKFTPAMRNHMMEYRSNLPKLTYSFVPQVIFHLFHGSLRNRSYMERHDTLLKYDFDPLTDVKVENNALEWSSDKTGMHDEIKQYFFNRKEDDEN